MAYFCYKCGEELAVSRSGPSARANLISRSDSCNKCGSDIRACKNCTYHDPSVYNECKESQADRILDKEKANYCDYFELALERKGVGSKGGKGDPLAALDELFKK